MSNEILKGFFLIASPEIDSGIFFRSVVLLCEHNTTGSLGLVINKSLDVNLPGELLDMREILNPEIVVCASGPVQTNQLMLLHNHKPDNEDSTLKICQDTYLGGDLEFLQQAASNPEGPSIKLCFGYSGWAAGQLEKEIINGQWFLHPACAKHIFKTPCEKLWRALLLEMGGRYSMLSMIPDNLALN